MQCHQASGEGRGTLRIALNAAFWSRPDTGSGQYLRRILPALLDLSGGEERFLLVGWGEMGWEAAPPRLDFLQVPVPIAKLGRGLGKLWFEQVSFPQAASSWGADLAHVPYFAPPFFSPGPLVVTIHDLIPLILPEYRSSVRLRGYMKLVSAAARRATHIVADSLSTQRDIVRLLGIPEARVTVVYLAAGGEFQPTTQPEAGEAIQEKYRLQSPYVLYLGGFERRKNLEGLLRAYALARTQYGFPLCLAIAGALPPRTSPLFPDPKRMVKELDLEGSVAFLGWVEEEDKPALYRGAALFVYPSLYEGFGLPVLEAMACGVPVVAAKAGALPEVVGEGGILVNPQNIQSLAEAMGKVLSDGALAGKLATKALEQARSFSWRKAAQETLDIYRAVAG